LQFHGRRDVFATPVEVPTGKREASLRSRARLSAYIVLFMSALAGTGCAPVVIGGAAVAGSAAAQERGLGGAFRDTDIQARINHLWLQHSMDLYQRLNMTVNEG
jgi:hypothetical protein